MMEGQMLNDNYCHISICHVVKFMAHLVIWSLKCLKMVKNDCHKFPLPQRKVFNYYV